MKQFGQWWIPDGDTHLPGYLAAMKGEYQRAHREASLGWCTTRRVALDIGAHIGLWTKDLSAHFELVHAFEPVEEFRQCFIRNVAARNVVLHPCALGSTSGTVRLKVEAENSGMTHVDAQTDSGVPMRTLDSFGLDNVDYIKLDVEGFELFVLEGARETLLRCRPVLTVEQKAHGTRYFNVDRHASVDFLKSLGAKELQRVLDDWIIGWR